MSFIVRFRVPSLMYAVCLLLGCAFAFVQSAGAQIRIDRDKSSHPDAATPAAAPIMTSLSLNLCVDGSTTYPCPQNLMSDSTYNPSITLTYGQILDGVVVYNPPNLTSGTITIYKDADAVCMLRIGIDTMCPANSTIFDVGNYTLSATLTFPPGSAYANFDTNVGPCSTTPTCDVTISIAKDPTAIALTSAPNPAPLGTPVTFTAVVSGTYPATPTNQVVFTLDNNQLPPVNLDSTGTATYTTSTLGLGQHTMTASYAGATDFLSATDVEKTQVIVPPDTMTTLTSSLNPSILGENVTFTANVATTAGFVGTPTGAVTFKDGTQSFATVLVAPKGGQNLAQTTISTLAAGTHNITAMYSGDQNTSPSVSSPPLVQQVDYPLNMPPAGYTIAVTPSPVSLFAGATANLTVTVAPVGGFTGTVTLSCSNLPNESACTFGEATIPSGGGSTSLALSTMSPHDCGSNVPYGGFGALHHTRPPLGKTLRYGGPALAGALLLLLPRRRRGIMGLLALAVVCALATLGGCGSHCTDFGTYPGGYTFKVNGAAPNATPVTAGGTPDPGSTSTPNVSTSVALTVKL